MFRKVPSVPFPTATFPVPDGWDQDSGAAQTESLNFSVVFFEQLCLLLLLLLLLLKYLKTSDKQMQDGNFSPTRKKNE